MINIQIGTQVIDMYLDNYSVNIIERYSTDGNFVSISGKSMNKYLGDRRELSVNFEPMENSQINQLFKEIKKYRNNIPIKYKDPQHGEITRNFSCNNLPSATYFVSDDGREFWTIPTVTFTETDDSASADDVDPEGSEVWDYVISAPGGVYDKDDISSDLSVSISSGSDGYSVGQCCSSSISGTLRYKGELSQATINSKLRLVCRKCRIQNRLPIVQEEFCYNFFVKSWTVVDKTIIQFTAVDVMAFVDNGYAMPISGTVSEHFTSAELMIKELTNVDVSITASGYLMSKISNQTGWTIRQLLEYAAVYPAVNYSALSKTTQEEDKYAISVIGQSALSVTEDECSSISVGIKGQDIKQIRVSQNDSTDPLLQEGEKYDDYGIYYLSNDTRQSNILNLVCPWAESDVKTSRLADILNISYGTEFNCENVKVSELFSPYTHVVLQDYDNYTFYISNATYKFTTDGIFANISGSTKSLSDFEYIGKTETQLKTKVALQRGYQNGYISLEDGIYWDDNTVQEIINNG